MPSGDAAPVSPSGRPRRQSRFLAFVRGLFGLIFAVGLVGAGAAGLIGWNLYRPLFRRPADA